MSELSLTAIDIVVVAVVLISAGFAMFRGLVHETFAILAWLAGGYVALRFAPSLQPFLDGAIKPFWLERVAVVVGTFLLVFIPLAMVSRRLSAKVKKSAAGPADRMLGLLFGVARGLAIVGLVYMAFSALVPLKNHPQTLTKARLFPVIRTTTEVLRELVPIKDGYFANKNSDSAYGADSPGALDRLFPAHSRSGSASQ
ncbi:MAG TPA: CvpA family protein [Micropepsaceae bacterium]|jgi:membrane protein required for colicin V production|nr:CvpA family protein [Micropepsaceae bacterium]